MQDKSIKKNISDIEEEIQAEKRGTNPEGKNQQSEQNQLTKNHENIRHYILPIIPSIFDGIGYGVLTFAQLLTMLYSMELLEQNPERLKEIKTLAPLLAAPAFAAIGMLALGTYENKEFIDELFFSKAANGKRLGLRAHVRNAIQFAKNYPGLMLILAIGAIVDGIVVESNVGYLVNQFGTKFNESPIYYPSMVLSGGVVFQFFLLNGPSLVELVEKGYRFDKNDQAPYAHYDKAIHNKIMRFLARARVNGLPLISAATTGMLGGSESYELLQYIFKRFQAEDMANRSAIVPALILGIIAFFCHFGLYGSAYKEYLARDTQELAEKGLKIYLKDNFFPSSENSAKQIMRNALLRTIGLLIAATAAVIGYSAIVEASYIFKYGKPPAGPLSDYQTPGFMSLVTQIVVFFFPAWVYGNETYAVESGSMLKLTKVWQETCVNENQPLVIQEINAVRQQRSYNIEKLLTDVAIVTTVGGTKLLFDLGFLPKPVNPEDIKLQQNLMTAGALMAAGSVIRAGKDLIRDNKEKDEIILGNIAATTNRTFRSRLPGLSVSWAVQAVIVYFITVLTQLCMRYAFYEQRAEEAEARRELANFMAATVGGVSTAIAVRTGRLVETKISNIAGRFGLFKCVDNDLPTVTFLAREEGNIQSLNAAETEIEGLLQYQSKQPAVNQGVQDDGFQKETKFDKAPRSNSKPSFVDQGMQTDAFEESIHLKKISIHNVKKTLEGRHSVNGNIEKLRRTEGLPPIGELPQIRYRPS